MELPGLEDADAVEPIQKASKEGKVVKVLKGGRKVTVEDQMAAKVKTISEIVAALIQAHNEGKNMNVSKLKAQLSSKNKLTESPKTVDIIAAIPDAYRKVLIPKLKTKPVRTASGVRTILSSISCFVSAAHTETDLTLSLIADRGGGSHVQAASVSAHCRNRQHLRLLPWRSRLGL